MTIAGSRLEILSHVLEVPADMLDLPLVRADLPAAIDDDRDRLCALDLAPNRRSPRAGQPTVQERFRGPGGLSSVSRAQRGPSTLCPSRNDPGFG